MDRAVLEATHKRVSAKISKAKLSITHRNQLAVADSNGQLSGLYAYITEQKQDIVALYDTVDPEDYIAIAKLQAGRDQLQALREWLDGDDVESLNRFIADQQVALSDLKKEMERVEVKQENLLPVHVEEKMENENE